RSPLLGAPLARPARTRRQGAGVRSRAPPAAPARGPWGGVSSVLSSLRLQADKSAGARCAIRRRPYAAVSSAGRATPEGDAGESPACQQEEPAQRSDGAEPTRATEGENIE